MNWWRFGLALIFWFHENVYYGWHRLPQSEGECIADGIVVLILSLSYKSYDGRKRG